MNGISWQNLLLLNASIPKYERDKEKKKDDDKPNDFQSILSKAQKSK